MRTERFVLVAGAAFEIEFEIEPLDGGWCFRLYSPLGERIAAGWAAQWTRADAIREACRICRTPEARSS